MTFMGGLAGLSASGCPCVGLNPASIRIPYKSPKNDLPVLSEDFMSEGSMSKGFYSLLQFGPDEGTQSKWQFERLCSLRASISSI
mmetsp:Transcript_26883/g.69309  ORF Transcript_26883/g.69309 Transcript_26883/m.69309 type:complete len:85 (+) Transcript_26883:134-388(+)|eukprot:scaffold44477_cov21-Tisochrysis_lutea.AAC.1